MSERITMKGVAECCEMFRANLVPMSPSKFWNNVAHGEYDGWVVPREDTKRRQATIYIEGWKPQDLCLRYRDGAESPLRRTDCRDLHGSKKSGSIDQHSDYCSRPHGQNGGITQ